MTLDECMAVFAKMRAPMTEPEIKRFLKRVPLFQRRGMAEPEAERLADELVDRDREREDMYACVECRNWQQSQTCRKRLPMSMHRPVRCHGFEWQVPT